MIYPRLEDGTIGSRGVACPLCHDWLSKSRLTPDEQKTSLDYITGDGAASTVRQLGKALLADPFGWFFIWGNSGTAKTLLLHALVAGYCRQGKQAVYYHAGDLADAMYKAIRNDGDREMDSVSDFFRRIEVLVIDELDKFHQTEWSRKQLQTLLDDRYRNMRTRVTIFAANINPLAGEWLPGDIQSRISDGRFRRRIDGVEYPGVFEVVTLDARPHLRRES